MQIHIFLSAKVSLKAATKDSFRGKKNPKVSTFSAFFLSKNGGVLPKRLICL